jgi:hypothetical protein
MVETVIITHTHASSGRTRHTVCVSSQVVGGPAVGLGFQHQSFATPQAKRGRVHPPCRHLKNPSCSSLASAFELAAFQTLAEVVARLFLLQGCAMGCKFCATGTMGLRSQLTAGEILEQVGWPPAV